MEFLFLAIYFINIIRDIYCFFTSIFVCFFNDVLFNCYYLYYISVKEKEFNYAMANFIFSL